MARSSGVWTVLLLTVALWLAGVPPAAVAAEPPPELPRLIAEAGLARWTGRRISLDETLRGPDREPVSLRSLVGKPILTYNYAQW
jgi:hypothetical protein